VVDQASSDSGPGVGSCGSGYRGSGSGGDCGDGSGDSRFMRYK